MTRRHAVVAGGLWLVLVASATLEIGAQVRLPDETDRAAFRAWFVFLADAQFYRTSADVTDCAALVRHAFREALRAHTPTWVERSGLPMTPAYPDVRHAPKPGPTGWPLFQVDDRTYAEFADAATLVRYNARPMSRSIDAVRPGDLLYFQQTSQHSPDHVMVFVGRSQFEVSGTDWVVYHTGPDGSSPGEVRKVRLTDLLQHPAARWRPLPANPAFVGVFRLTLL
jgi:uncharacterized protein